MSKFIKYLKAIKLKSKLSRNLIVAILAINSVFSLIITLSTTIYDYTKAISKIDYTVDSLKLTHLKQISVAIWNLDQNLLKVQLEGLQAVPNLSYIEVISSDSINYKYGDDEKKYLIYDLPIYGIHEEYLSVEIAKLKVGFNTQEIMSELLNKVFFVFLVQFFKTLIVSMFLLFLFHKQLVKPINKILEYLQFITKATADGKELEDLRTIRYAAPNDEIDDLALGVNKLKSNILKTQSELRNLNRNLDHEVKKRTQAILNQQKVLENNDRLYALGRIAGAVAHEINTPLAAAVMRIEMLKKVDQISNNTSVTSSLDKTLMALDKISQIVKTLRSLYRDNANEDMGNHLLSDVLSDLKILVCDMLVKNKIDLHINLDEKIIAQIKRNQMIQVLINLVNNSIDALENLESKWIRLSVINEDGRPVIVFSDSGTGIPDLISEKMFDPFYTTKDIGKGTGIGLSVCKNLLLKMDGDIVFDRQASNTTFKIYCKNVESNEESKNLTA